MIKSKIHYCYPSITQLEKEYASDAAQNGWGENCYKYIDKFESNFKNYLGVDYAIATSSCTGAIQMGLHALDIKEGDEIILADTNWVATLAPIIHLGATPVFVDILEDSWCLDPQLVEKSITSKTKAIIAVHLYGNLCNMKELLKIGKKYNIPVVEDSAEALGTVYNSKKAGSIGLFGTFSFHGTKTITTGEGGMLLIDDEKLYDRCKFLRDHGRQPGTYFNTEITYKYMPFNVQAALGLAQFQRIDELVEKKRWIWNGFKERLSDIEDIYFNPEDSLTYNSVWATALILGDSHKLDRDSLLKAMNEINLPIRPFFYPLSSLPAFNEENIYKSLNLNSYKISRKGVNLPCALNLDEDNLDFYSEKLKEILIDNR